MPVVIASEPGDDSLRLPSLGPVDSNLSYLGRQVIWAAAAALILVCVLRYLSRPTFWLDEAGIALSLREPLFLRVFRPLARGLYFPRMYLLFIALVRDLLGYRIWVLRLVPSLSFIGGTLMWARLLAMRAGSRLIPAIVGAALLIGADYWLVESIQVKQYSLEVAVSLIPFLISDETLEDCLVRGRRKRVLVGAALLSLLSYTYPLALGARLLGWYLHRVRFKTLRLNAAAVLVITILVSGAMALIFAIDIRQGSNMSAYWSDCVLSNRLQSGAWSMARLLANFLWGWHYGRLMPLMIAVLAPLQVIGATRAIKRLSTRELESCPSPWGSRTMGSLFLLAGTVIASTVIGYPICAGRLMLFTQPHTQILVLEGTLGLAGIATVRAIRAGLLIGVAVLMSLFCGHRFLQTARSGPQENIKPLLPLMRPEVADTVWVQYCSLPQVRSLPDPLPVPNVVLDTHRDLPRAGSRIWVLWTHMDDDCRSNLDRIRSSAVNWQVVAQGRDSNLVLAQF